MDLDPRHLAQLSTIVDAGSFTNAAADLGLAPSALSRNIKSLELKVGGALLERGRAGVTATPLGKRLAEFGKVIRNANIHASEVVSLTGAREFETIRIAATRMISHGFLVHSLSRLLGDDSEATVQLMTGELSEIMRMVALGEADLSVGKFSTISDNDDLFMLPVVDDFLTFVSRQGHPLISRNDLSVDTLKECRWVLPRTGSRFRWNVENAMLNAGITNVHVAFEFESPNTMMAMVENSDCITMVPFFPVINLFVKKADCRTPPGQAAAHHADQHAGPEEQVAYPSGFFLLPRSGPRRPVHHESPLKALWDSWLENCGTISRLLLPRAQSRGC